MAGPTEAASEKAVVKEKAVPTGAMLAVGAMLAAVASATVMVEVSTVMVAVVGQAAKMAEVTAATTVVARGAGMEVEERMEARTEATVTVAEKGVEVRGVEVTVLADNLSRVCRQSPRCTHSCRQCKCDNEFSMGSPDSRSKSMEEEAPTVADSTEAVKVVAAKVEATAVVAMAVES